MPFVVLRQDSSSTAGSHHLKPRQPVEEVCQIAFETLTCNYICRNAGFQVWIVGQIWGLVSGKDAVDDGGLVVGSSRSGFFEVLFAGVLMMAKFWSVVGM